MTNESKNNEFVPNFLFSSAKNKMKTYVTQRLI